MKDSWETNQKYVLEKLDSISNKLDTLGSAITRNSIEIARLQGRAAGLGFAAGLIPAILSWVFRLVGAK